MGRVAAIAFAPEGADLAINYLRKNPGGSFLEYRHLVVRLT